MIFFIVFFSLALITEGVLSSMPLTFIVLLTFLILKRQMLIFYLAFISGIILDILSVRTLGISSIYFLTFFFSVLLYERKFEIQTPVFLILASFLGSLGFLLLTQSTNTMLLQAIASAGIALIIFKMYESRLRIL